MLGKKELGKKLFMLRSKMNLSQEQVARYLEIDSDKLSEIEHGECAISVTALEKLASLYCLSLEELCDAKDNDAAMQIVYGGMQLNSEDIFSLAPVNKIIVNQRFMNQMLNNSIAIRKEG